MRVILRWDAKPVRRASSSIGNGLADLFDLLPRPQVGPVALGLVAAAFLIAGSAIFAIEPYWIIASIVVGLVAWFAIRNFPAAFIAPLIFIGNLKGRPAEGMSLLDPTMLAIILLGMTVVVNLVVPLPRERSWTFTMLASGQVKPILAFLVFGAVATISYQGTLGPEYGADKLSKVLTIGLVLLVAPVVLVREKRDIRHFFASLLFLSVTLAAQRSLYVSAYTVSKDFTNIGSGVLFGMTLLALLHYRPFESRPARLLVLCCIPIFAAGIGASFSRDALLSFVLTLILSTIVFRSSGLIANRASAVMILGIVVAVAVPAAILLQDVAEKGKLAQKIAELSSLSEGSDPGGSAGERLRYYSSAFRAFSERPITGWGIGSWPVYYSGIDQRDYPHNLVLEVAAEEGLLGITALFGVLVIALGAAKKAFRATNGQLAFLFWLLVFHLIVSMGTGDLDDHRPLWMWCGMAVAGWRMVRLGAFERAEPAALVFHQPRVSASWGDCQA